MSESYRAVLVDGELRWIDDVPGPVRHGSREIQVRVTVEERGEGNDDELTALLDKLAEADPFDDMGDPVDWQRSLRAEPGTA